MSELLALSHVLSKPRDEMTPLDKSIMLLSAVDEDLANEAAEEYGEISEAVEMVVELASKLDKITDDREKFFLNLCKIVGLSYEDTDEDDLLAKFRTLAAYYKIFAFGREDLDD